VRQIIDGQASAVIKSAKKPAIASQQWKNIRAKPLELSVVPLAHFLRNSQSDEDWLMNRSALRGPGETSVMKKMGSIVPGV
jgi:hypothetical protein